MEFLGKMFASILVFFSGFFGAPQVSVPIVQNEPAPTSVETSHLGAPVSTAISHATPLPPPKAQAEVPCGPTKNCASVLQATIENSCAPWDGHALRISTIYNGGELGITLFAKGLQEFEAGQSVVINSVSDSVMGTGLASFCKDTSQASTCFAYRSGEVGLVNLSGVFKKDSAMDLQITIKGAVVPVEARWVETTGFCG